MLLTRFKNLQIALLDIIMARKAAEKMRANPRRVSAWAFDSNEGPFCAVQEDRRFRATTALAIAGVPGSVSFGPTGGHGTRELEGAKNSQRIEST